MKRVKLRKVLICMAMLLLFVCTLPGGDVKAADKKEGDFIYSEWWENGDYVVIITGYTGSAEEVVIPDTLGGHPVTGFERSFEMNQQIKSITIPASVESIELCTFRYCRNLKEVTFVPGSRLKSVGGSAFNYTALKNITLPSTLEKIGGDAFREMDNLESIVIPKSVRVIRYAAFASDGNLAQVIFEEGSDLKCLEKSTFEDCVKLKSVNIPDTVEDIGPYAFSGCKQLQNIKLPSGVKYIEAYAFANCETLESMELPVSVDSIEEGVFKNCKALKNVVIPPGTTHIGNAVFEDCASLQYVCYPESMQENMEYAKTPDTCMNISYKVNTDGTIDMKVVNVPKDAANLTIPTSISGMPVASVTYPDGSVVKNNINVNVSSVAGTEITDKKSKAVYKITQNTDGIGTVEYIRTTNKKAKKVNIPATINYEGKKYNVTGIAENAFRNNRKIKKLTIGKNIENIGAGAFYNCKKLKSIVIKTSKLTKEKMGDKAFKGIPAKAKINVPKKKRAVYKKVLRARGVGKKVEIK